MVLGSFTSSRGGGLLWICSCPGVPHLRRVPSNPTRTPSRACSSTRESRVFQNGRSIPLQRIVASASFTTTTCRRMSRRAPGASKAVSRSCRRHTDPMYKTPAQPSGLSRHGSCHGADSPAAFPASFRRRGQSDCGGFPDFHRSCLFSSAETDTRAETLLPPLRFCLRPSVSHKATCCFATCTRCFLSSFPSRSTTPLAGSLPVPHAPSQNSPCSLSISHAPARAHMSTAVEHLRTFPSSSVHLQLRIASVSGPLLSDFSKGSSRSRWSCAAGLSFISSSFVRPFSTTKGTGTRDSNSSADADSANSSASSSGNSLSGTSRQGGDAREGGSRSRVVVPPPVGSASKGRKVQLSKKELKAVGGHPRRYKLMGGRPEFHHVDRNRNGHIIEPTDKFQVVLTTSKNNVHAQVVNKSRAYRTIFGSFAGNVGYRKQAQQDPQCAYRIGQNIARKCKRLGISQVEVKFRRIMRVNQVLQAFVAHGLGVSSITHEPRLPKCGQNATKPRKRRRV